MANFTPVSYLVLNSLAAGPLMPLYFFLMLLLYLVTVFVNVFLIAVIVVNRSLHEPVYIFIGSLFINALFGCSSLLPFILAQLFTEMNVVSLSLCSFQIFLMYTYSNVEFFNLAAMAYDRYIAICVPLKYAQKLSPKVVTVLLGLVWGYGLFMSILVVFSINSAPICGNRIHKIYCNYYDIESLSCLDYSSLTVKIGELVYMCTLLLGMVVFIVFTYVRILVVCLKGSRQTRQKAISTCAPHLASLLNYGLTIFLEEIQTKFNLTNWPRPLQVFLSMYIAVGPPLLNCLLYGFNMSKLRAVCRGLLSHKQL